VCILHLVPLELVEEVYDESGRLGCSASLVDFLPSLVGEETEDDLASAGMKEWGLSGIISLDRQHLPLDCLGTTRHAILLLLLPASRRIDAILVAPPFLFL